MSIQIYKKNKLLKDWTCLFKSTKKKTRNIEPFQFDIGNISNIILLWRGIAIFLTDLLLWIIYLVFHHMYLEGAPT
jgi:hypothetical protein